jgi:phage antirepressor YoqD-like protein
MNDLAKIGDAMARTMTVGQVALALGYEYDTIRKKVKELFPTSVENGKQTLLTEAQVLELKQNLTPRTLALKSEVANAVTDLEMKQKAAEVMAWLLSENKRKDDKIAADAPKVAFCDRVTSSDTAIDMGTVAKVLNLPYGRNTLFAVLRGKKILMADNRPYQEYMNRGYFKVIEEPFEVNGETKVNFKTLVYQSGIEYISRVVEA